MIMGDTCTRKCGFCSVQNGQPRPLDPQEPYRVAEAAKELNLSHVVVTSVTRDDLPDGGAQHYANTIRALKQCENIDSVEVLTSDFNGSLDSLRQVLQAGPDIFNHNLETIPRLYAAVRPEADYARSLSIIEKAASFHKGMKAKSGLMVGFAERPEEVENVLGDLREAGCSIVTIGQYLRPELDNIPVAEYVSEETFSRYETFGKLLGFEAVYSSPFVRSSYRADLLASKFKKTHP
jgi:lipoic acid synthetase